MAVSEVATPPAEIHGVTGGRDHGEKKLDIEQVGTDEEYTKSEGSAKGSVIAIEDDGK